MVSTNVGNEFSINVISRVARNLAIMKVTINNEQYTFNENISLEDAVSSLELKETKGIALALNEQIIPRSKWNETILNNEDKILIIGAVAGG